MSQIQVILIGGPPGAGKSTLGRVVAAELGYASLTADDLLVSARALTTKESHPALHQMSGVGHVSYFTGGPKEKLVSDSLAQEEAMWSVLKPVSERDKTRTGCKVRLIRIGCSPTSCTAVSGATN